MISLQEQSDYLVKNLLHWSPQTTVSSSRSYGKYWNVDTGDIIMPISAWTPHTSIEQCFKYLVPAMRKRGLNPLIEVDAPASEVWVVNFWGDENSDTVVRHGASGGDLPAAIVQAAYNAIKEQDHE